MYCTGMIAKYTNLLMFFKLNELEIYLRMTETTKIGKHVQRSELSLAHM